ncbi:MAG TPA: hypothetical protein VHD91_12585 [Gaiellaceae bacterium]|nr:hypothetical protein [Gaiellaceae bacterium]
MQPDPRDRMSPLGRHLFDTAQAMTEALYGSNVGHSVKAHDDDACGRCGGRMLRDVESGAARCAAGCGVRS